MEAINNMGRQSQLNFSSLNSKEGALGPEDSAKKGAAADTSMKGAMNNATGNDGDLTPSMPAENGGTGDAFSSLAADHSLQKVYK